MGKQMRKFTEGMVKFYAAQIAMAIDYMHRHHILYRDLKPENVLLGEDGYIRITDYGLSKIVTIDDRPKTFCGTPEYLAPELILHRRQCTGYGFPVDWWGLGIVMYELLTGFPPFMDKDFDKMCNKILTRPLIFPSKSIPTTELDEVVRALLHRKPEERLGVNNGVDELKEMKLFADMDFDAIYRKEVFAPFVPLTNPRNLLDTRNFDVEFTRMKPRESIQEPSKYSSSARLANSREGSRAVSSSGRSKDLVEYDGFTFSMDN